MDIDFSGKLNLGIRGFDFYGIQIGWRSISTQ